MAHSIHRWKAESIQVSLDLQHVAITWMCEKRGCWLKTVHSHTFRKPPGALSKNRASPGPDWIRKEH